MDAQQILEHALSLIFGSAGGIAAGVARMSMSLSEAYTKMADIERRQVEFEHHLDVVNSQKEELTRHVRDFRKTTQAHISELRQRIDEQAAASSRSLSEAVEDLRRDFESVRSGMSQQQVDIQRTLGSLEGTLQMLAKHGCGARSCQHPPEDNFPSEGTTYRPISGSNRAPR